MEGMVGFSAEEILRFRRGLFIWTLQFRENPNCDSLR